MVTKRKVESGENIPLSFYFDLSGSMEEYTRVLSIMALRIMKKGVKIIVGFNQNAYAQINEIPKNCTPEQFINIMEYLSCFVNSRYFFGDINTKKIKIDYLEGIEIDEYLIQNNAEKVVVFSDFDPKDEIENLSKKCEVYWFCFNRSWKEGELEQFKGKFFKTRNEKDIVEHLKHINSKVYERKQRKLGKKEFRNIYRYNVNQNTMSNYSNLLGEDSDGRDEFGEDEYSL